MRTLPAFSIPLQWLGSKNRGNFRLEGDRNSLAAPRRLEDPHRNRLSLGYWGGEATPRRGGMAAVARTPALPYAILLGPLSALLRRPGWALFLVQAAAPHQAPRDVGRLQPRVFGR